MRREEKKKCLRTEYIGIVSFLRIHDGDAVAIGIHNFCERGRYTEVVIEKN